MSLAFQRFSNKEPPAIKRSRPRTPQEEQTQVPPPKAPRRCNAATALKKDADIIGLENNAIQEKYGKRPPRPLTAPADDSKWASAHRLPDDVPHVYHRPGQPDPRIDYDDPRVLNALHARREERTDTAIKEKDAVIKDLRLQVASLQEQLKQERGRFEKQIQDDRARWMEERASLAKQGQDATWNAFAKAHTVMNHILSLNVCASHKKTNK